MSDPPSISWRDGIGAMVCDRCGAIWSPVEMIMRDVIRDSLIRASVARHGKSYAIGEMLGMDRHAIRRWLSKYGVHPKSPTVIGYSGPTLKASDFE